MNASLFQTVIGPDLDLIHRTLAREWSERDLVEVRDYLKRRYELVQDQINHIRGS